MAELPLGTPRGRQGGRWYNERPSAEEVAEWFKNNVKLHEGLKHEDYVGGLTLIAQTETPQEVRNDRLVKVKNLVYTPYGKVESRVQYFWDLMTLNQDKWAGSIEPVDPVGKDKTRDGDLPPGFYRTNAKVEQAVYAYIACCMRVRVVQRDRSGGRESGVILSPPATKMVPVLTSSTTWVNNQRHTKIVPDPYAMMKAETGAVGRALGLAGMLIIPGAGVATAEDMLEAQSQGEVPDGEVEAPTTPQAVEEASDEPQADGAEPLIAEVKEKLSRLEEEKPEKHKAFQEWAKGRGFTSLDALTEVQARGLVRRIDKDLA